MSVDNFTLALNFHTKDSVNILSMFVTLTLNILTMSIANFTLALNVRAKGSVNILTMSVANFTPVAGDSFSAVLFRLTFGRHDVEDLLKLLVPLQHVD